MELGGEGGEEGGSGERRGGADSADEVVSEASNSDRVEAVGASGCLAPGDRVESEVVAQIGGERRDGADVGDEEGGGPVVVASVEDALAGRDKVAHGIRDERDHPEEAIAARERGDEVLAHGSCKLPHGVGRDGAGLVLRVEIDGVVVGDEGDVREEGGGEGRRG